jgi:hypothetical protein
MVQTANRDKYGTGNVTANCVEWPLPLDPDKPSSCTSADHMRRTGTPGCTAADLHLLTADSAEHPALDLPDWLRLWPMLFGNYPLPDDYPRQHTDRSSLRLQLAHELCGRPPPPWWCAPTSNDGAIGQATAAGLWTTELSSKLRGAMPARHAAVRSGQVRFITRPKSRTMRAKRNKRSRANRTNVPK